MQKTDKELMTVDQFLEIYSISRTMYYTQVRKKLLKTTKLGKRIFIKRTDAEIWLSKMDATD